ncbi:DUF190 domain-containing protein [Candidatus Methylocalor cossyra]|uniref:DUF190 domain-containing protein n=1 Tax=Candidatus Methylocalor cossyra TaxID=3108543 RepID=A0ABM9NHM8_9GAMM
MNTRPVTLVRIFLREGEHVLDKLVHFLHVEQRVVGLTVLRGIIGVGQDGRLHPASLVELSLDLPLVVEFFDQPEQVERVVKELQERFQLAHVVCLPGQAYGVP